MSEKHFLALILTVDALVIFLAFDVREKTGVSPFSEGGFVTFFSGFQLLTTAVIAFLLDRRTRWESASSVWKIISLCFVFLAADEIFRIHENVDFFIHYLFKVKETALTDRIDDLIVGMYGLVGAGFLFAHRDKLKPYRKSLAFFTLGFTLLFGMVVIDVITNRNDVFHLILSPQTADTLHERLSLVEDPLKIFAEGLFITGFYATLQIATLREKESTVATVGR